MAKRKRKLIGRAFWSKRAKSVRRRIKALGLQDTLLDLQPFEKFEKSTWIDRPVDDGLLSWYERFQFLPWPKDPEPYYFLNKAKNPLTPDQLIVIDDPQGD